MKKITLISACMLLFTVANAEQMQFVTTLSAPVGNFAHLDAADSTHVTTAPILNFCNTRSNVGNIVIKGANAYLKQVNVQNGTALGSTNTPEYRLSEKLTVENGGTVTAGRIMANNVTFKDTNYHKSQVTNAIYGNDIAVMGGKTDNMEISGTAKINKSAQNSANLGEELWWDNQYASDYDSSGNKKTNGKTYTSFLLKSKNGRSCPAGADQFCEQPLDPDGVPGTWNDISCTCTCPAGTVLIDEQCIDACKNISSEVQQKCTNPQDRNSEKGTWNYSTCACECPEGTTLNEEGECYAGGSDCYFVASGTINNPGTCVACGWVRPKDNRCSPGQTGWDVIEDHCTEHTTSGTGYCLADVLECVCN